MLYHWHNGKIVDNFWREVEFAKDYEHNQVTHPQPAQDDETETAQESGEEKAE